MRKPPLSWRTKRAKHLSGAAEVGTSALQKDTIIVLHGRRYLMLREVDEGLWQLEDCRTKRLQEYSDAELRSQYQRGELVFESLCSPAPANSDEQANGPSSTDLDPELLEKAKIRRAYVVAVLDVPCTQQLIVPRAQEVWEQLKKQPSPEGPPHWTTVCRWKSKYVAAGRDFRALVSKNAKRGNRASRYPKEVLDIVSKTIERTYLTREQHTIADVVDEAITLVKRENALRPESFQLPYPTRRLVTRLIEKIPAFDRCVARHGQTEAVNRFRCVLQHRVTGAPLERAEIDHTLIDLMVIDDDSGLPLGRPYITACIDDHTRCLLGIHVSFTPPSYLTVARCLRMAILPKVDLAESYPSIKNAWKAHGVMSELVVDNGLEFHSTSLENACYTLGIDLQYNPRRTPWYKGKIERLFRTMNDRIAHTAPGTTFSNIFEKGDYDPSKTAVVRWSTFQEVIRMWIVDEYHQKPHRSLDGYSPAQMWESSIEPAQIPLADDVRVLDAILGRSERRRLTHKGIQIFNMLYNSAELAKVRRRHGENLEVELRVDEADIGHISVITPDERIIKVPSLSLDYADGLSRYQHEICRQYAANCLDDLTLDGWREAKAEIASRIETEMQLKKRRSRSRAARYAKRVDALPPPESPPEKPVESPKSPDPGEPFAPDDAVANAEKPERRTFSPVIRDRKPRWIDE